MLTATSGLFYAISHLRYHAETIRRTIAAYGKADQDATEYWSEKLAATLHAIGVLEEL